MVYNLLKFAQAQLKFDFHDTNKRKIVIVYGNTFPIKQQLKDLGFQWYGIKKIWWMYQDRFDLNRDANIKALSSLGVTIPPNAPTSSTQPAIVTPTSADPQKTTPVLSTTSSPIVESTGLIVKTDKTKGHSGLSAIFPVNNKIYEGYVKVIHEGQELDLFVVWGRKQNQKYNRTIPRYDITIYMNGHEIRKRELDPPDGYKWLKSGPNFNEDKLVADYMNEIPKLANKPDTKLYFAIKWWLEFEKGEPEYKELLQKIDNDREGLDWSAYFPPRKIHLDTPYEGEFSIKIKPHIYLKFRDIEFELFTDVSHPLAPHDQELISIKIPPTIHSLQDANAVIDQQIAQHIDDIKAAYAKYLSSFAFTQEQKEKSAQEIKPIVDMITSGTINTGQLKAELMKRKFIRPSRRAKRTGEGMVPADSFQLIIDDKAIRDATFSKDRFHASSPEYFYTAIAYNLMRIKHNNISFMPMFLIDAYNSVTSLIHRFYDKDFDYQKVADYIDKAARAIYTELTGRSYRSWDEVYSDFYSGNWGTSGTSERTTGERPTTSRQSGNALDIFSRFVADLNMGITQEEAAKSPRSTYRKLAILLHPDSTKIEDKDWAEDMFSALTSLYDNLPQEMKMTSNWYKRIKLATAIFNTNE